MMRRGGVGYAGTARTFAKGKAFDAALCKQLFRRLHQRP
jgi:hypothetical protein